MEYGYDIALKKQITALSLSAMVRLKGPAYSDEKRNLISGSLGLVYPAVGESFGRVPFEAVSLGTYPLVPDRSGSAEYLRPFLPGCVYREGDASSLAGVMAKIEKGSLSGDSLAKANEWMSRELGPDKVAENVFRIYEKVSKTPSQIQIGNQAKAAS